MAVQQVLNGIKGVLMFQREPHRFDDHHGELDRDSVMKRFGVPATRQSDQSEKTLYLLCRWAGVYADNASERE